MARDSASGAQVKITSIFGSSESQVSSRQVRGGRVFVLFGSAEVDLRDAALADGEAAVKIVALFGEVKVSVPDDWAVNVQTGAVLGRVDYKPNRRGVLVSPTDQLTLNGFCSFGRIEIRS